MCSILMAALFSHWLITYFEKPKNLIVFILLITVVSTTVEVFWQARGYKCTNTCQTLIFTAFSSHNNAKKQCLHGVLLLQQRKSLLIFLHTQKKDNINCYSGREEDLQPPIIPHKPNELSYQATFANGA